MINGLRKRLSSFSLLVGGAMLALFFTSDAASAPNVEFLLWGIFLILLSWVLGRNTRDEPKESSRFRTLRRLKRGEGVIPKPPIQDNESANLEE